mmetsp:Transcript_145548/g.362955  ORF Transcript_145548/g.362955 Transcript_145548/m.362955 type:complete len:209 (+) Transcript_145548:850-1476(+)
MSPSKPRSAGPPAAGAGAAGAAAAGAGLGSRRSRRSPPPPPPPISGAPAAGAAGFAAAAAGGPSSRRSLRSRRSFAGAAAPTPGPDLPPAEGWTSSMDASPMSRLSAPAISRSETGMRSRMPARLPFHSFSSNSKNSQERCCKSTCKLHSNLRKALRMRSNSPGQRVTSLISAVATRACAAAALFAFGGLRVTSISKSRTSPGAMWIG